MAVRNVFVIITQRKELLHVAGETQESSLHRIHARLVMSILIQGSLRTARVYLTKAHQTSVIAPPPSGVAPPPSTEACPENTARDAKGNCAPLTQTPKAPVPKSGPGNLLPEGGIWGTRYLINTRRAYRTSTRSRLYSNSK